MRGEKKGRDKRGYRGFPSRQAYEAHYSDVKNYLDELPAMEAYSDEVEVIRIRIQDENRRAIERMRARIQRDKQREAHNVQKRT